MAGHRRTTALAHARIPGEREDRRAGASRRRGRRSRRGCGCRRSGPAEASLDGPSGERAAGEGPGRGSRTAEAARRRAAAAGTATGHRAGGHSWGGSWRGKWASGHADGQSEGAGRGCDRAPPTAAGEGEDEDEAGDNQLGWPKHERLRSAPGMAGERSRSGRGRGRAPVPGRPPPQLPPPGSRPGRGDTDPRGRGRPTEPRRLGRARGARRKAWAGRRRGCRPRQRAAAAAERSRSPSWLSLLQALAGPSTRGLQNTCLRRVCHAPERARAESDAWAAWRCESERESARAAGQRSGKDRAADGAIRRQTVPGQQRRVRGDGRGGASMAGCVGVGC